MGPGNVVSVNSSFSFLRFLSVFFQLFFLFSSWASYVFVSVSVSVFFPFSVPGLERSFSVFVHEVGQLDTLTVFFPFSIRFRNVFDRQSGSGPRP